MNDDRVVIFPDMYFGLSYKIDENPNNLEFKLHNHNDIYEIVLLLDGDCEFCVEGNTYQLTPYDIVMTRPFEMHHIVCLTERTYERIILYINADYFVKNHCEHLREVFENRNLGTKNLIPAQMVQGDILSCINRIHRYVKEGECSVARGVLMEFLYLINHTKTLPKDNETKDKRIRDVILYINQHLTQPLSLQELSQKFYIDKYYLCKTFKKNTGYTLNQYINYKRILLVQKLHQSGESLTQASANAGFNNYSNFYKIYLKQMGKPPKSML